ncbi:MULTISPECIES: hypothetical protein [unclassified Tolypothrix]|uniref:hypothetical protein n=1 Tax=unclassified Tolypothrix TaxID=2649714 RepID=UPI0005EAC09C|nr:MULTISPECIES: hypothetical protein [unclassified Tolypothrix]BAY91971.1 hypothetical protein NIES3275_40020 [Microchaete diplosiphon NIES-3275]EKF04846.1 hypothetical protein FDUTEX481_01006 [Tolypothrix sp. PCC 7601]MBE9083794.1 hypothetical protein [Tolypothrix sp. LEGE 11397]UYD25966.1 hypothetical protein HGR01_32400 [Tolypothrix sp. PCC 7712]UYD31796.1 hypothetical protein HG267_22130 [Tolypothrix sp. PCC 7601]
MNSNSQKFRKSAEFLAALCGGLLMSVPALAQTPIPVTPQPSSVGKVNPCPRIFYEEPHNSRVLVPQGCPPNALTQQVQSQGTVPYNSTNPSPEQTNMGVGGDTPGSVTNSQLNPNPSVFQQAPYNRTQQPAPTGSSTPYSTPQQVPSQTNSLTEPSIRQQGIRPIATVALTNGNVNVRLVNDTGANVTYQIIGDTNERSLSGKSDIVLQNLRAPITVTFQREDGGLLSVNAQPSETGLLEVRLNETTDVAQDAKAMRIQSNGSVFLN